MTAERSGTRKVGLVIGARRSSVVQEYQWPFKMVFSIEFCCQDDVWKKTVKETNKKSSRDDSQW